MLKRFLLFVSLILSCSHSLANSQFSYEIVDGGISITDCMLCHYREWDDVVIPEYIDGYAVVGISSYAFGGKAIRSITFPNTLKTIGEYIFSKRYSSSSGWPSKISNLVIPDSVTSIGMYAFRGLKIEYLTLGEGLLTIGHYAFDSNKISVLEIPDSLVSVDYQAFSNNDIESLLIGNGLTTIGSSAFSNNKLTSLSLASTNVTSIGNGAFSSNELSSVYVGTVGTVLTSIGSSAFSRNRITFLYIPDGIVNIGSHAFSENRINNLRLPDSLINIGTGAFQNNMLTSVHLPKNLEIIEWVAFQNNQISRLKIPDSVKSIGQRAFYNNQLINITIPAELDFIGSAAFQNNKISNIKFLGNVISGGFHSVQDFDFLTLVTYCSENEGWYKGDLYGIPNIAEDCEATVFEFIQVDNEIEITGCALNCSGDLVIPELLHGIPVTSIGYGAFSGYDPNTNSSVGKFTSLIIPEGIKSIGEWAFFSNQLSSVTIPSSVSDLPLGVFQTNSLTNITIPDSVTTIGPQAFYQNQLTSLAIPVSITSIGYQAFISNPLKVVHFLGDRPVFEIAQWSTTPLLFDNSKIVYCSNGSGWPGEDHRGVTPEINNNCYSPFIYLDGETNITLNQNDIFTYPNAIASDAVDGLLEVVSTGEVDTSTSGEYWLSYSAENSSGYTSTTDLLVEILDVTPPVILIDGNLNIIVTRNEVFTFPYATANDNVDGPLEVKINGEVDTSIIGEYAILYSATDSYGNAVTENVTVNVVDIDTDSDGIGDLTDMDDDGDGVDDSLDAFPLDSTETLDTDLDGIGNNTDNDDDNDGIEDTVDFFPLNKFYSKDLDLDGMSDRYEEKYGLNKYLFTDADSDYDEDGLTALVEFSLGTSPISDDSDMDMLPDVWEINNNTDPANADYQLSLGRYHLCALENSVVSCWGLSDVEAGGGYGELNIPILSNPTQISSSYHSCVIDDSGVVCWGRNDYGQTDVPTLNNPIKVSTGLLHTCALDDAGIVCWGRNDFGQADVPTLSSPSDISSGDYHNCAVDTSGTVCWGLNSYGQITVPDHLKSKSPIKIDAGYEHTCALYDSEVVCWGGAAFVDVPELTNPKQLSVATYISCAIDDNGAVCWGVDQNQTSSISDPVFVSTNDNNVCIWGNAELDCQNIVFPDMPTNLFVIDPDNDGFSNVEPIDVFPFDASEWFDLDQDDIGNNADLDDDGDGIEDLVDVFPFDDSEAFDNDNDGVGDNADNDDDNDGFEDSLDALPFDPSETQDTDADGIGNNADLDDDNDGVDDIDDLYPLNHLYHADSDSDNMPDAWEVLYGLNPNDPTDTASDYDNDGAVALQEFFEGTPPGPEVISNQNSWDFDHDGTADALTDGLLFMRYTFGMTGAALTDDTISSRSSLTSAEVETNVTEASNSSTSFADIDGSGSVDALTDGLLLLRYLFGFTGDSLIDAAVANGASRQSAADIEAYIESHMP